MNILNYTIKIKIKIAFTFSRLNSSEATQFQKHIGKETKCNVSNI